MEWTERYNCHELALTRGITVHVDYIKNGFIVSCLNRRLEMSFKELPEAKLAGIRLARKIAQEILDATKEAI